MSLGHALEVAFLRFHQSVYLATDGRIGHRMIGVPSLLLRTTGRRSGERRTAAVTYARDGSKLVLVASNDGLDRPPAWLLNAEADPSVEVQVGRRRSAGLARVVGPHDADYPRLWTLVNDNNHHRYEGYQSRTDRPIVLLLVTPSGPLT